MGTRTVRLDEEAEKTLAEVRQTTGWSISDIMKQGLLALRKEVDRQNVQTPFEVYQELDLGPGGYAIAPSTESRRGVQDAIRRKLRR